ncbi:MAG: hypothetical protein AAFN11_05775 [Chloroflexota bacterium]
MSLRRDIKTMQAEIRMIDDIFAEHAATSCEIDTELIETLLVGWEDFLDILRDAEIDDEGGRASKAADLLYDTIEATQEKLARYEETRAAYEEALDQAEMTTRLQQCTDEHDLAQIMKAKYAQPDIGREHLAQHRLKQTESEKAGDLSSRRRRLTSED